MAEADPKCQFWPGCISDFSGNEVVCLSEHVMYVLRSPNQNSLRIANISALFRRPFDNFFFPAVSCFKLEDELEVVVGLVDESLSVSDDEVVLPVDDVLLHDSEGDCGFSSLRWLCFLPNLSLQHQCFSHRECQIC